MEPSLKRIGIGLMCVCLFGLFLLACRPTEPSFTLSIPDQRVTVGSSGPLTPADAAPSVLIPAAPHPEGPSTPADLDRILAAIPDGPFRKSLLVLDQNARARALQKLDRLQVPKADYSSLHVAATGALFYACSFHDGSTPTPLPHSDAALPIYSGDASVVVAGAVSAIPISSPPIRHSRPGSVNVLYLDFNGHTITDTAWNADSGVATYVAMPYDTDGDPATFNAAEQAVIIEVWERVAEDYAPFDIDVTTEEPAVFTSTTGRAVITRNTDANKVAMPGSSHGGVAWLDVFGDADYATYMSPAFIYANDSSNVAGDIAELTSHEFGHNMGLSHDGQMRSDYYHEYYEGFGTGATSWGPIMGAAYGRNLSQWSKGEYPGATNGQDDLAIIAAKTGYCSDEAGDTLETAAAPALASDGTFSQPGVLANANDIDLYTINTGAGRLTFSAITYRATSGTRGGNADVKLELLNAAGVIVAVSDPYDNPDASLTYSAAAGTYYIRVSSSDNPLTGYTSYGSAGQYLLQGSIIASSPSITSASSASIGAVQNFRYIIVATNSPSRFTASGLPYGLWIDEGTGVISGRPQAVGTFSIRLEATNSLGTGTSIFTLTVTGAAPTIISQTSLPQLIGVGTTAALNVYVLSPSGPVTYQWKHDGLIIDGASRDTLTLNAATFSDSGVYQAFITNDVGTTTSSPILVSVLKNAASVSLSGLMTTYNGQVRNVTATTKPAGLTVKLTYNESVSAPTNVGDYWVSAVIDDPRYQGSAWGHMMIFPVNLAATVDAVGFIGQSTYPLSVSYSGFVAGDDISVIDTAPTVWTTATSKSAPGTYPVRLDGGQSKFGNYDIVEVPGHLQLVSYAGTYEVMLRSGTSGPWIGKLELTMGTGAGYTGRLWLGGEPAPLSLTGALAFAGSSTTATGSLQVKGYAAKGGTAPTYTVALTLPEDGALDATVGNATTVVATSEHGAKRWVPAKGKTVTWMGAYTLLLRDATPVDIGDTSAFPGGAGYASAKVSTTGELTLAGALADGTKFTATLSPDDGTTPGYRLFMQPYGKRTGSYVAARFTLRSHPSLTGRVHLPASAGQDAYWAKGSGAGDAGYRSGFGPLGLAMTVDPWLVPNSLTTMGGRLSLGAGNTFDVTYQGATRVEGETALPASIVLTNGAVPQVPNPNTRAWSLKIAPATGVYHGSFTLSDPGLVNGKTVAVKRTVPFAGVLRQPPESDVSDNIIGAGAFQMPLLPTDGNNEKVSGEILFTRP